MDMDTVSGSGGRCCNCQSSDKDVRNIAVTANNDPTASDNARYPERVFAMGSPGILAESVKGLRRGKRNKIRNLARQLERQKYQNAEPK